MTAVLMGCIIGLFLTVCLFGIKLANAENRLSVLTNAETASAIYAGDLATQIRKLEDKIANIDESILDGTFSFSSMKNEIQKDVDSSIAISTEEWYTENVGSRLEEVDAKLEMIGSAFRMLGSDLE